MAWQRANEVIPIDDDDYQLRLTEERDGDQEAGASPPRSMVFIHLKVKRWTASVLKRLLRDFRILRQHIHCPLFAYADEDDEKWEHFVTHFGFEPLTTVSLNNGEVRRLFCHFNRHTNERKRKQEERDDQREFYEEPLVGAVSVSATGL